MNEIIKGKRYYKYTKEGARLVYRIVGFQNKDTVKVYNPILKINHKIPAKEIFEDDSFKLLKPDGYLVFNIVNVMVGNTLQPDIMICLFKENESIPSMCLRTWFVLDGSPRVLNEFDPGLCLHEKNLFDCNINQYISYHSIIYSDTIAVYKDDTLNQILKSIKLSKFDSIMNTIRQNIQNFCNSTDTELHLDEDNQIDYVMHNLWSYLKFSFFVENMRMEFDILSIAARFDFNEDNSLEQYVLDTIEFHMTESGIISYYESLKEYIIIPYDRDIEFNKLQMDYILICEFENDGVDDQVYVFMYVVEKHSSPRPPFKSDSLLQECKYNVLG